MSEWTNWSTCNEQCKRNRTRYVMQHAHLELEQCSTELRKEEDCKFEDCACKVTEWGAWSNGCNSECKKTRSRTIFQNPVDNSATSLYKCPSLSDWRYCTDEDDGINSCKCAPNWSEWTDYDSNCKKSRTYVSFQPAILSKYTCPPTTEISEGTEDDCKAIYTLGEWGKATRYDEDMEQDVLLCAKERPITYTRKAKGKYTNPPSRKIDKDIVCPDRAIFNKCILDSYWDYGGLVFNNCNDITIDDLKKAVNGEIIYKK